MMLGWIFFFACVALGYLFWNRQQQARLLALQSVRRHCQQEDVQLLDDTLVLERIRIRRIPSLQLVKGEGRSQPGGWRLVRTYRFEFSSTGDERYQGLLTLIGRRVAKLELQAHRIH